MTEPTDNAAIYNFSLGYIDETSNCEPHTIWIKDIVFEESEINDPEKTENGYLIKSTHDQFEDDYGKKWVVKLDPKEYGIENPVGKDIEVSVKLKGDGAFEGRLGAVRNGAKGWIDAGTLQVEAGVEAEWKLSVDDYNSGIQIQIDSMSGEYVELYDITMKAKEEDDQRWLIHANAESKGTQSLNPEEFGVTSPIGKNIKVTVKLLSKDDFCGTVAGNDESGWNQTNELRGVLREDGMWEGTWENTFTGYGSDMQIAIWWMGASDVEILEVKMEDLTPKVVVLNNESPKENGNIAVELPSDESAVGKHVVAHIKLESAGQFNGMLGGCNAGAEDHDKWEWSQTDTLWGNAGTTVWDMDFPDYKGALKIFIYWAEKGEVIVRSITFEEITE